MPTNTWNGSFADWHTSADWSLGHNPGPSEDVVFGIGVAQLLGSGDAAINVKSITFTGGELAIQDPGKIRSEAENAGFPGGAATLRGPCVAENFAVGGALRARPRRAVAGPSPIGPEALRGPGSRR
jgi:hypothetical protein